MSIRYVYTQATISRYVGRVYMIRQRMKNRKPQWFALVWHPSGSRPKFGWVDVRLSSYSDHDIEVDVDADLINGNPEILVKWDAYIEKHPIQENDGWTYMKNIKIRYYYWS